MTRPNGAVVAPSIRFPLDPRDVPASKAARRLGMTEAEFLGVQDRLFARGFPRPDPDTARFDLKAVEAWMDRRSGLTGADASIQHSSRRVKARLEAWDGG